MSAAVIDPFVDVAALAKHCRGTVDVRDATALGPEPLATARVLVTAERGVTPEVLALAPHAHTVVTASTGTDHLDMELLSAARLRVQNVEDYCTAEVAEHALACALSHLRRLPEQWSAVRCGEWSPAGVPGITRLSSARMGIVGTGRIGRALASRAALLGMTVETHSLRSSRRVNSIPRSDALADLAGIVDVLVICAAPGGAAPLIDAHVIRRMHHHAALVNVARASSVDTEALSAALRAGNLGAAYFDVWPQEPPAPDDPLLFSTPRLYVTPHVGWYSPDSQADLWRRVGDVIKDLMRSP